MDAGGAPSDREHHIAAALNMPLEELRRIGTAHKILSGHDELKAAQSWELMNAFRAIENPKTRTMVIMLVEEIASIEKRQDN